MNNHTSKLRGVLGKVAIATLLLGTSVTMTGCIETLAVGAGLGALGSEAFQNHNKVKELRKRMDANDAHDAAQDNDINQIGNYVATKPWTPVKKGSAANTPRPATDWRSTIPQGHGGLDL